MAAILSNKVMKHSFVQKMEDVLDNESEISHESLSTEVEGVVIDPNKIGVKISTDSVDTCYNPIIQSGGKYDIKVSAYSNQDKLSADIIIASLGARYKGYCATLSRTYMIDAVPKVEKTYATLLALYNHCLEQIIVGMEFKTVVEKAKSFVAERDSSLSVCLPKTLGFCIGLEFRDGSLTLNDKNTTTFKQGMVLALSVGFHNVPLSAEDKENASVQVKKLNTFSLLLADTIKVVSEGPAEELTKSSKEFSDVSYKLPDKDDEEEDDDMKNDDDGLRRSKRSREEKLASENAAVQRAERQKELTKKKVEEAQRKLAAKSNDNDEDNDDSEEVNDLSVYRSPEDYPKDIMPNQLKVDLEKETLIVPIHNQPVAFHVSTIKSINMPEPDKATYLRINFFTSNSIGKETPKNTAGLLYKYGDRVCFIKELTFRSLSQRNLQQVYMQFQELRKRVKQREQKAEQEKDLVVQSKLIRIKDQRVPRLADLTMRPSMTGRKSVGTLEAHQNGVRFTSVRQEVLDVLYANVKHAIYQPCDPKTSMVIIHFHLKDFIMIGKKKQKDVTFFTEVVDTSVSLDASKRSSYDPDELDEEQREREMRRRLNLAFKEFCLKLEKVAAHYDYSLNIDVPFVKSAFEANPHREMVRVMPTTHCLVNLTETPVFCLTISDIEHVHFERAGFTTKAFDIVLVFKDWNIKPRTLVGIETKYMDIIQEWLNLVEITYTMGNTPMSWDELMNYVKDDDRFWYDTDHEGVKKPAGWQFLDISDTAGVDSGNEDDADEAESSYGEESDESSEEESDDSEEESDFTGDDESDDDDDDSEDEGKDWDEMERDAAVADKAKRNHDGDEPAQKKKVRR